MNFNPDKLYVEFRNGVTPIAPIIGRRYTLTHSDDTAELFLAIGLTSAFDKINVTRDEVLGEWIMTGNQCALHLFCHVGGEMGKERAKIRYLIFKKELRLVLESLRYGDRILFEVHPYLDQSQIWVKFNSMYSDYDRVEYWGIFSNYS